MTNFSILHQILMSSSLNNLHSRLDKREFLFHMKQKTPNTFCWEFLKISPLHIVLDYRTTFLALQKEQ